MILTLLACWQPTPETKDTCEACGGECVSESAPTTSRSHVDGEVAYPSYPPMSGDHNACWAEWGVHTEVVQPENWVHNLEHGGVVFVYAAELGAEDLAALTALVQGFPEGRALLTPASDPMDALVAAVSWEHRILLGCYDGDALTSFFWANIANAPEDTTSPPGACAMASDTGGPEDTGDTAGGR